MNIKDINKTDLELRHNEIKRLTPFLNHLKLTNKQRAFIYYYCTNGFKVYEAAKLAGYGINKQNRKHKPNLTEQEKIKNEYMQIAVAGSLLKKKPNVIEGIKLFNDNWIKDKKSILEKDLLQRYITQATYDPSMFYNEDGSVKFASWGEIPEMYRCCIESMEVKYYGKDCEMKTVSMKLIDRKWAQDKLDKYIEMIKEKTEIGLGLSDETINKLDNIFNNKGA